MTLVAAETIDISFAGITLSHEGPYKVGDLTGWEGLPPARVDDTARANAHGSFDAPVWVGARTVVAEGYCYDPAGRSTLLADLGAALVPGGADPAQDLQVTFADRTLTARARLTRFGATLKNWGVGHFGWQAEWWCPDPYRYGATLTAQTVPAAATGGLAFPLFGSGGLLAFTGLGSPGLITLTNPGTAPAWPLFTVLGSIAAGFTLTEVSTGRRIQWEADVPAGVEVTIDPRTGSATYDGQPGYGGNLTARQWWSIPPGGTSTVQLTALGLADPSALLTASWAPTYW